MKQRGVSLKLISVAWCQTPIFCLGILGLDWGGSDVCCRARQVQDISGGKRILHYIWRDFQKRYEPDSVIYTFNPEIQLKNLGLRCGIRVCKLPWSNVGVPTCNEGVLDAEAKAFELLVAGELDPHEAPRRCNQARVLSPTEAVNERREPKWPVADFDVVEAALEWWLDVVILIKRQLNPLSRKSFGGQESGERKETKGLNPRQE